MRLNLCLFDGRSDRVDHVVLSAEPESAMADVVGALDPLGSGELFVRGEPLTEEGHLASSPLLDGDVVEIGEATTDGAATTKKGYELAIVGGPLAGAAWPLRSGEFVVGRGRQCDISVDHPSISEQHFRVLVEEGRGAGIEDLGARNGTAVDGRRLSALSLVRPGQVIQAGACVFALRGPIVADADVRPDREGGLAFNRPARIRRAAQEAKVTWPAPPSEREGYAFPWIQVLAPLVLATVAALVFKRPEAMLFALMSPVLAVSNVVTNRKRDERRSEKEGARYDTDRAAAEARIAAAATQQTTESREGFPDPATLAAVATGPSRRLWERREGDSDAMLLRIGLSDRPAAIVISGRGGEAVPDPPVLPAVPITVDLARAGVFGVAGPTAERRAVTRWLVAQLAALRSPREVQLVVLTDADAGPEFDWVRWLPHARLDDRGAPLAMIGNDKLTREERVRELVKLLELRLMASREHGDEVRSPAVVVIFDGVRDLRNLPGVTRLLKEGPGAGIYSIGLDSDATRLAEEGRAELLFESDAVFGELRVDGVEPVPDVLLDQVSASWADQVGRALAPIRDVGGEEDAVIPDSVRFVDLAGLDLDQPDEVSARWILGGRTTEALVGASVDGPFRIDLKRDGPHGLVAGTTGSGKSEFLQTLVVSLALANRPWAMNFVLIDYKGASAFADCERLPHTVGMVTNLDGHLTERALASLDAELERREHVLRDLGAADVDSAWERDGERAAAAGLARLVLVIDEFAELVQELPEFVAGLIRIARVGRSLGVHLILATQRPAGVVSSEMRANTGLRVGLRMEDKHDSSEVLEAPDAAAISRSTPGRGFVRTGGSATIVQFQTARVAGRRRGATEGVPPPRVVPAPWNRLGYPPPASAQAEVPSTTATDLHALVEMVRTAAERVGEPEPRRPWLAPLPDAVTLDEISPPAAGVGAGTAAVFGIEDIPALQAQRPATYDLSTGGHLLVIGAARSGRSTALRTLAASLARSTSPSDLHLYGLDFGNGALLPLQNLPHCGGVVMRAETDRAERLVSRLGAEVARRQQVLARSGFADISEQRAASAPAERLPHLVVLLDRWEGFLGQFPPDTASEVPGALARLVREGLGAGLRLVIAGDRSLLSDRLASLVDEKLILRLSDRNDFRLANISPKTVPEEMRPGRALRGDSGIEVQFALLAADSSGPGQAEALRRVAEETAARWPEGERHHLPFRVDAMPSTISFDEAWSLAGGVRPASPLWALAGVGGDELTAHGVDLGAEGGGFVIGGPAKSGRSTALVAMARSLLAGGAAVVAVCPRPSPLSGLDRVPGVLGVFRGIPPAGDVTAVLDQANGAVAVLVDDAEVFSRSEADEAVKAFLRASPPGRVAVVVAGQIDEMKNELRGVIVEAKKAKVGLLLSPTSTLDGELVSLRLARNLVGRTPPGRGILAVHGDATVVQVPQAT
jgi:DNA segregation ATPase FtsK/SpoIIIE, S-DNA-T family